ncbi:unnamed protein product [Urochloa humidicola]
MPPLHQCSRCPPLSFHSSTRPCSLFNRGVYVRLVGAPLILLEEVAVPSSAFPISLYFYGCGGALATAGSASARSRSGTGAVPRACAPLYGHVPMWDLRPVGQLTARSSLSLPAHVKSLQEAFSMSRGREAEVDDG